MTLTAVAFLSDGEPLVYVVDPDSHAPRLWDDSVLPEGTSIIAVVPGQDVLQAKAALPHVVGRRGQIAARFAMEEQVAVDPATLHVAVCENSDEAGHRLLWAVDPARMDQWHQQLARLALTPDVLVPDYALLPNEPGLQVMNLPSHVVIKCDGDFAAAVEEDLVPAVLGDILETTNVEQVLVAAQTPARLSPLTGWGDRAVSEADAPSWTDLALRAAALRTELTSGNLLQASYRPKTQVDFGWPVWRRSATLAASILLIWTATMVVEGWRLNAAAEAAYAQAEQVLRDALPGTTRVVNPRAQLRAALSAANGAESIGFLENAAALNEALAASEGIRIEALRFDPDDGRLNVTLNYGRYQELEYLSRRLEARGAQVTEGGSRQSGGRVIGELTVRLR